MCFSFYKTNTRAESLYGQYLGQVAVKVLVFIHLVSPPNCPWSCFIYKNHNHLILQLYIKT